MVNLVSNNRDSIVFARVVQKKKGNSFSVDYAGTQYTAKNITGLKIHSGIGVLLNITKTDKYIVGVSEKIVSKSNITEVFIDG
jgi:hypothetical protein